MLFRSIAAGAFASVLLATSAFAAPPGADGTVLPFPPVPSASVAAPTLQGSRHQRREQANHLPAGAPNILIILLDDVGFGLPGTYGGDIRTPTLSRIANTGVSYNTFHTTAICSPTRAALLTGRNHQRVGSGTIAERAVDWDGYVGVIPKTSATVAETLRHYGYKTSAFGKWHNTPADQTTAMGPFDRWPTGHGFDYFYGFVAGETSQWEPRLFENTTPVEPPHDEKYHLSEDLADKAVTWLRRHRSYSPDKPFLMYWAPGAGHGPHQIFKEWADKYKGQFDDGWDAMRERIFKRQKELGWIPADTKLTARPESMASWESIPANQRAFQLRLMEVFAGFVEHVDVQAGKVIDELERLGERDNTLIFYIFGDNGSSAEGQNGSISELLAQNQIPNTVEQQIEALNKIGGLDALGSPKTDNMYHAGWAWAGNAPFKYTKLIASHFGGTRNPMAISWPKKIKADKTPRGQFHHVNDIVPTIYETVGITTPKVVDGFVQDPIDGVSLAYTFNDAKAAGQKTTQYFDNNGSRGVYRDGWFASTFGPLTPWLTVSPGLATWDSAKDVWELYDLSKDFSQANDLAATDAQHLARLKEVFQGEARENKAFPIGAGIWLRIHPEDRLKTPYTRWVFDQTTTRMPEFTAPGLGRESSHVAIDAEFGDNASGVLYAMGGASGGLSLFMDSGQLVFEYNMMIIERYTARSAQKIPGGRHAIEVETTFMDKRPLSPAIVVLKVDGVEVARTTVQRTVPAAFTASETLDVGVDLGSPVSLVYFDRRPFRFGGKIGKVEVRLK
ncbi:arylsulfatase [Reyranella sp.]|uniref:arylsulfatase n=1 Tax=Reyranella sp. TaxID=1929291 RepID=UPI003D11E553